jgi:cytochrome oxidase Cu insertion factor (SCO1/SenC/PrrC family)
MLNMKTLLIVFLLIFVFTACQNQNSQQPTPAKPSDSSSTTGSNAPEGNKVGDMAPAFTLEDMKGQKVELKSFRGKKVVHVVFWSSG